MNIPHCKCAVLLTCNLLLLLPSRTFALSRLASLHRLSLLFGLVLMGVANPLCGQQTLPVPPPPTQNTLEGKRSYTLPLVYDPLLCPSPIVYVSINEQDPLPFLLDTGAGVVLTLTTQSAKTLHLLPTGETVRVNNKVKASITRLSSIRFPLVDANPQPKMMPILNPEDARALIFNLPFPEFTPDGKSIAGIVGVVMLMKSTACLDFAAKTLTIYPDPHPSLHLPEAVMLPLKRKTGIYFVTLQAEGYHPYDYLLDTGCAITQMPSAVAEALQVREVPFAYSQPLVGGAQENYFGLLPSLPLGTLTPREVGVAYAVNEKAAGLASLGIGQTILGMNLLSRYRLTFDFPNNQVHLQPGANYADAARVAGLHVLGITRKGTQVHVSAVLTGSAAYRAGVRKGDVLLSIEDRSLQGLSETALQSLIDGYGGTQARLQIQRDGQTRVVTYPRYSLAVVAVADDLGLDMHLSERGHLFVDGAQKKFPAYICGLRKGDEILTIAGQPVEATDVEALLGALSNPKMNPLPLTLLHKGETSPLQILLKWR